MKLVARESASEQKMNQYRKESIRSKTRRRSGILTDKANMHFTQIKGDRTLGVGLAPKLSGLGRQRRYNTLNGMSTIKAYEIKNDFGITDFSEEENKKEKEFKKQLIKEAKTISFGDLYE
jgi:hypothetical protein